MARTLTDKQRGVLEVIEDHWRATGGAPSVDEIASRLGLRKSTTHKHLMALEQKGALVHVEGRFRSWRPASFVGREKEQRIPILGRAPAGPPREAIEDALGWLTVPDRRGGARDLFALAVDGDSMVDAGILDGDLIIVRQQDAADDGDIVLALIDEETATIKRLEHAGAMVRLKPENPDLEPIEVEPERVRIQGKVIGLRREYE